MKLKNESDMLIFNGIEQGLIRHDNVPIVLTPDVTTSEKAQLNRLLERRVDGIIMLPQSDAMFEGNLDEIIRRHIPLVVVDNPINEVGFHPSFVGTDDMEGGRLAAEHLLEQGHRKFGILSCGIYPQPMHFRKEGFEAAVKREEGTCVFTMTTSLSKPKDIISTALELLKLGPTAVFVTLDPLLLYIYQAAEQLKLSIPEDLSVIGFAGFSRNSYLNPIPATLVQPFEKIGDTAAEMLISQINGEQSEPENIRYTPFLNRGHSTASPKK